jgi:hypothetical protein
MEPRMLTNPAQFLNFGNHLNLCTCLVQQSCAFQRTLASSYDGNALSGESLNVATLIAVGKL